MGKVKVAPGGIYEVGRPSRGGGKNVRLIKQACDRIEELEVAVRAALSFVQERHPSHDDGHAVMVIAALRGALRSRARD